jgi:hypothetical protein
LQERGRRGQEHAEQHKKLAAGARGRTQGSRDAVLGVRDGAPGVAWRTGEEAWRRTDIAEDVQDDVGDGEAEDELGQATTAHVHALGRVELAWEAALRRKERGTDRAALQGNR